nr:hypothetical protein [Tanacetum cinerariifolium]
MAISIISVSSNLSEESVGTSTGRVILFDYTPASPDYSPASDTESDPSENPSSDHIPPLPATSPFLSSIDDSSENDVPDTPPSPTYGKQEKDKSQDETGQKREAISRQLENPTFSHFSLLSPLPTTSPNPKSLSSATPGLYIADAAEESNK